MWRPSAVSEEKSKISQPIRGQGGHLVFPNRSQKHKLGRGYWDIASYQVLLNFVQQLQRRSRKCLSQSEARGSHLVFPIGLKNKNLVEVLRSGFLSSSVAFRLAVSEEKSKMWKVNDGQMDDGQRVITIVHMSLRLRCTKKFITRQFRKSLSQDHS